MTQDEIKKGLEYAAKVTGNGVFSGAYKIITEQEIEIERLKEEKKQAQIDVLNKLKTKKYYVWGCGELLHITEDDIDELIKEIENDKCNC